MSLRTIEDIFNCWDTIPEMADDVGVSHWTASKWKQRNRISQDNWPDVLDALNRKGQKLSADDLLVMHTKRRSGATARAAR